MRKIVSGFVCIAMVSVLAACGGGASKQSDKNLSQGKVDKPTASQPAPKEKVKARISVGGLGNMIFSPVIIAKTAGFFDDAGVDVTLEDVKGGADAAKALAAGNADFAIMAFEHVLKYRAQGVDFTTLVVINRGPGAAIAVDSRFKEQIKTVKDLGGKRVGITSKGSGSEQVLDAILRKEGVDGRTVEKIGVGNKAVESLEKGEVIAVSQYDPYITQLVSTGKAYLLRDLRKLKDVQDLYGSDYPFGALATRDDLIKRNPELVQRVVTALTRAMEWMDTHSAEEVAAKTPADIRGDEKVYIEAMKSMRELFPVDGMLSDQGLGVVAKTLKENKVIPETATFDIKVVFNPSFLQEAHKAKK